MRGLLVEVDADKRICSFCGTPGSPRRRLIGGLGATICVRCVEEFHGLTHPSARSAGDRRPPGEDMSEADLLASLPLILRTADQVDGFAAEWVRLIRDRGVSWAAIGQALGVSRQAAWERFSKRITTDEAG